MNVSCETAKKPSRRTRRTLIWARRVLLVLAMVAGFSSQVSPQEVKVDPVDLSLEDLLDLTVSSASKYAQRSADAPGSITIITSEEIQRYGFRNLAEALQTLSSFSIASDHSYTYTGVRGFARPSDYNNRVLVLIDGHTKNEAIIGAGEIGDLRMLDISDVARVEVVRGPGSSLYGAHAMLAVLNVITKSGADIDGSRVWAEAGSYGNRSLGLQFGRHFQNGLNLAVSGGLAESDGEDFYFPEFDSPQTGNGVAAGLSWGEVTRARASLEYGTVKLWGAAYSRARGMPTAPFGSVFAAPGAQTDDNRWLVELQYQVDFQAPLSFTIRTYADHFETLHDYPHENENLIDLKMSATWVGSEARVQWDVRPEHRLVMGAEVLWVPTAEIDMADKLGLAGFQGDFPYHIGSLFLQDEFQFSSKASLTVGVRHDRVSSTESSTTPRVALVYHPWASSSFKALWGTAFRAPNIYEENFESSFAVHLANPELKPERIESYELVFEQRLGESFAARAGVFRSDFKHLVDQHAVAWPEVWPASPTGSPFVLQFQNGDLIRAQGLELELNAATRSGHLGFLRYGFQKVEEPSSGAEAPNYPVHSMKAGGSVWVRDLVTVGGTFLWESERRTLAGPETDSYSLLDLTASTKPLLDHFVLSVSGKNVLDTKYSLPSGPQHSLISVPQQGRRILIRLGVNW